MFCFVFHHRSLINQPISTQPLGTPEINKKSMTICNHLDGGEELFIIGKNFLKDAKVIFRNDKWMKIVEPNREYLKSVNNFSSKILLSFKLT